MTPEGSNAVAYVLSTILPLLVGGLGVLLKKLRREARKVARLRGELEASHLQLANPPETTADFTPAHSSSSSVDNDQGPSETAVDLE